MSRVYDAKQAALSAYPDDKDAGVTLLLSFLSISEEDFTYNEGQTPTEYIYGK
tara:strand:- start:20071 stop:20229 length:159 start_codon:yes stop_codon:yes gene_type:complete